jgi:hypothetical protein
VNTGIYAVLANYALHEFTIADIALVKRYFGGNGITIPTRQVIEHNDRLAARPQQLGRDTADIPSPACDQNCHGFPVM